MTLPVDVPIDTTTSFERLVREHQSTVWRYLRFLGCAPVLADDLSQETFLRVLDGRLSDRGPEVARAYLKQVAKTLFLKSRERDARRREVDLDTAEAAFEWYAREDGGDGARAALAQCVEELVPRARKALDLRFAERLDRDAIAARLGIGAHGAKSLLQRTYARLRACIERRLGDG